ncbi:MAG: AmmeMemoRadiSam system protein A [Candidatus Promineofilum sp.]|nr:AmmeMemoRadiSam system protein A [Promineifilum sp.]
MRPSMSPHADYYPELLRLARATLAHYLATGEQLPYAPGNDWFREPAAIFVTLRVREARQAASPYSEGWAAGDLRGCVGHIYADKPLSEVVQEETIQAATVDPRFDPVTADELDNLIIEISVLSPFRPVESLDEVVIGQDGLYIVGGSRRALLLPEVPLEYGWDQATFLHALIDKAGLPPDVWPARTTLYAFTTESFEEHT